MPASTTAANNLLNLCLRGVAWTPPSRVWVSLHTADPGNDGASEVSTGDWPAYERQDPAGGDAIATGFDAADAKAIQLAKQILFPRHDGTDPVSIGWVGIWDAATGGNLLLTGYLQDPAGDPVVTAFNPNDEPVLYPDEMVFEVD